LVTDPAHPSSSSSVDTRHHSEEDAPVVQATGNTTGPIQLRQLNVTQALELSWNLRKEDAVQFAAVINRELARGILDGRHPALVNQNSDGSLDITILTLTPSDDDQNADSLNITESQHLLPRRIRSTPEPPATDTRSK